MIERMPVPKTWMKKIYIDEGPLEGQLALPCKCGREMNFDDDVIHLVKWTDGTLMFVHNDCVQHIEEEDDDA